MAQTLKQDIGVVRDGTATMPVIPTITDMGVPSNYATREADNMPQGPTHRREETDPQSRQINVKGIGVPYNPNNGVTSE